eukprot:NODE_4754_length_745_cov_163.896440_g4075_i1.p1 GENE.NODE_4754_length_745_cov_163.896440_g4075_i1~~NODE_4754_length_745_cov_163.896440_g4075_i1.p1  ORF type:complete len:202 (+),score=28.09 NODE_4754_length_745_cov_163.896440_g4075_i1:66-671(+)
MPFEPENWYRGIPVVTRVYLTLACLTSGAVTFEFVSPFGLYLNYRLIWQNYQYSYSRRLEEHFYHRRTADFFFMLLFGAISMLVIAACIYRVELLAESLVMMVVYIWARRNPEEHLNLLGLFTISAPYVAFVILGIGALFGGVHSAAVDLIGMGVGHIYWYLADILPRIIGREILKTPSFVAALFPNDDEMEHDAWRPAFD